MNGVGARGVHGTALAIENAGLLIVGAAGTGKSALAAQILEIARQEQFICRLVGDDRVLVREENGAIILRPHPQIAGLFALRGQPVACVDYQESCILQLVVRLESEDARKNARSAFPVLSRQQEWVAHLPSSHLTLQRPSPSDLPFSVLGDAAKILRKLRNFRRHDNHDNF